DGEVEKIAADCALGENAPRVWKLSQLFLDLNGKLLNLGKIRSKDFHAEDAAKPRGEHFRARLDWHPENVRHARRLDVRVDLGEKLFPRHPLDRKSTRLNSSHVAISYAVFCLKKKKRKNTQ